MCYDTSKWEDAYEAILKSSIALPKYCVRNEDGSSPHDWHDFADNYQVPELPQFIVPPLSRDDPIEVTKDSLTYDFDLNEEGVHCYLQFFLKCKKMVKTAGMGDTISGTGWVYHEPKRHVASKDEL